MLLISGYSGYITRRLKLSPALGAKYWGKLPSHLNFVLKDYNLFFIDPDSAAFSSTQSRYEAGYVYAGNNLYKLKSHIKLSGNILHIIAHSHGVAFAEGISAYLYEKENFITDLLVSIQGTQLARVPQQRFSISSRIVFKTKGDIVSNKKNQRLPITDIEIIESSLKSNFIKYSINFPGSFSLRREETVYIKGKIKRFQQHMAQRKRQFQIWSAINHAIRLYMHPSENALAEKELVSTKPDFLKHVFNQN